MKNIYVKPNNPASNSTQTLDPCRKTLTVSMGCPTTTFATPPADPDTKSTRASLTITMTTVEHQDVQDDGVKGTLGALTQVLSAPVCNGFD